jgi:hypothetical protein
MMSLIFIFNIYAFACDNLKLQSFVDLNCIILILSKSSWENISNFYNDSSKLTKVIYNSI